LQAVYTVITVVPDQIDFGTCGLGTSWARQVVITNTGQQGISIRELRFEGDSDFTFAARERGLWTIDPGASETIVVHFVPLVMRYATASLTIESDDQERPTVHVWLSGEGVATLHVEPESVDFGRIFLSHAAARPVTIVNKAEQGEFDIVECRIEGRAFSGRLSPLPFTLTAQRVASLNLLFSPGRAGTFKGSLLIRASGHPERSVVRVPLVGSATHWFQAEPNAIDFGRVAVGQESHSVEISVINRHRQSPCEVRKVRLAESPDAEGSFRVVNGEDLQVILAGAERFVASVRAKPLRQGEVQGLLRISYRLAGEKRGRALDIPVRVEGV
jgi:hypothetical protein